MDKKDYLIAVKQGPRFQGKKDLILHLGGISIGRKNAILAKCYECMGFYDDGGEDCMRDTCPLYPYMPYRKK